MSLITGEDIAQWLKENQERTLAFREELKKLGYEYTVHHVEPKIRGYEADVTIIDEDIPQDIVVKPKKV